MSRSHARDGAAGSASFSHTDAAFSTIFYAGRACRTQVTMAVAEIAPDWRATSRPFENRIRVGIERIPKRAATACSDSVSNLPRRTLGSSWPAAAVKAGAICWQGPHQVAQKSTSSGMSLLVACAPKLAAVRTKGCFRNSSDPHRPHLPPARSLSFGTRFAVEHDGQITIIAPELVIWSPRTAGMGSRNSNISRRPDDFENADSCQPWKASLIWAGKQPALRLSCTFAQKICFQERAT